MTNAALRDHVTSIGFAISLSKNQIDTLVALHHSGGFNKFHLAYRDRISSNYCATAGVPHVACELCDAQFCDHRLTRAGVMVAQLLDEAGIYQEVLDRYGIDRSTAA